MSLPPFGIASRAFTARFTTTCSSCETSAFTGHRSRPCTASSVDLLAEQALQQHREIGQRLAEIEHLRPQGLPPRERQQMPHQARGAVGVLLDLHDVAERGIGRLVRVEQEVGRHHDGGEHVVEVVRDAAGKLADRVHLLHLRDLLFQIAHFGGLDRVDDRGLAFRLSRPRPPRHRSAPSGCPRRRARHRPARCRPARPRPSRSRLRAPCGRARRRR